MKQHRKTSKALISMETNFLEKVDEIARGEGTTRSELVRRTLREYIKREYKPQGN